MPRTESAAHVRLKQLALEWAGAAGFATAATEVRVPRSGFRADVAAASADGAGTIVFECKQSRPDFLKDAHAETVLRGRLEELAGRKQRLEELLALHRPDLRRGEAFWPEFDTWDFEASEHQGYRRVLGEAARCARQLRQGTKFARMVRYRCADFLYLVLEPDIFAAGELPAGWGVLVRSGGELRVLRRAPALNATAEQREKLRLKLLAPTGPRWPAAEAALLQLPLSA